MGWVDRVVPLLVEADQAMIDAGLTGDDMPLLIDPILGTDRLQLLGVLLAVLSERIECAGAAPASLAERDRQVAAKAAGIVDSLGGVL